MFRSAEPYGDRSRHGDGKSFIYFESLGLASVAKYV